ncbi:MAG TPA: phosphatase PAP2 family protein [Gaiellaceae bacterium]|nr:phosphatase PAP2 family protein [Gaiellaceae bacterium]
MFRRSAALPLALAAAYAGLAVLVAAGALTGLDQWAVDHLMPGAHGNGAAPTFLQAVVPLYHASWHRPLDVVANVVTLPAQALVSSVLLAACCLVLYARGRRRAALAWAAAWLVGIGVEVLCKSVLARPLLHRHGLSLAALESSFPSGHTLRALLLAAAAAFAWPAGARLLAAWAAAVLVLLEVDGLHVPSDIAGGLLLAALVVVLVRRCAED